MVLKFFVYGTLKQGFHNAGVIPNESVESRVPAHIEGYDMYSVGGFPAIVNGHGVVHGEVVTIKQNASQEQILRQVDRLEGEGHMYRRDIVPVTLETGETEDVYVYVWLRGVENLKLVPSGVWSSAQR